VTWVKEIWYDYGTTPEVPIARWILSTGCQYLLYTPTLREPEKTSCESVWLRFCSLH